MRNLNKLLKPGALFLCLGGWVCDGRVIAADSATQVKEAVLNTAVAQAIAAADATDTAHGAGAAPASSAGGSTSDALTGAKPAPTATATTVPPAPVPEVIKQTPPKTEASANLAAPVVNVGVDGMIEQVNFQDLDINTALHFLSLQSKRNIIASKEVKGTVTANLYNVTFTEALESILRPNGFDFIERGNFIYVYTTKEIEEIKKRDHKTVVRLFRLHYLNSTDASILIKPLLSSSGAIALTAPAIPGLPTGVTDTGGMNYAADDTLVINDYPENLNEIDKIIKELDIRPKQVLVESTILNATLTDANALGVDIISLSGIDFPNLLDAIGGDSGTVNTGDVAGKVVANGNTQANFGTDFAGAVPPGGLSIGFLSNHVSMFVRALETVTNTTVVANPKVLTLNKQHGEVLVGRKLGYLTTTSTQTTTDQTVQFIDVGTKLVFRPFIKDDGYIRMEIHPEDSSGSIDAKGVPQKSTTEVTSNVMIKDGRTIVLGGLFRESSQASRGQVPVLGNIPILGVPFRQTSDTTDRTETIVLITPHIISDDTAMYDEAKKQAEDVHRMLLGTRADQQPWSRDRISQLWYSMALEELQKGCKEKAIMYTEWCLNSNPEFVEALKLREKLTNTRMEEAMQSSISSFVTDVLKADAHTTPDVGGAAHYYVPPVAPAPVAPATMPAK